MKKIYHLGTCQTCKRILSELEFGPDFILQDIKSEPLSSSQLDELHRFAGSYAALFSKRSRKYRAWALDSKDLSEKEMRDLILKEYTFLKRPVVLLNGSVFAGSSKETLTRLTKEFGRT